MTAAIALSVAQHQRWRRDIRAEQCRRSFARFFREGWHVIEPTRLRWNWHLQLQCDVAQAFAEGWLVSKGYGTPAMVERQRGYWRLHGREMPDPPPRPPDGAPVDIDMDEVDDAPMHAPLVDKLVVNGGPGTLKSRIWMVYLQAWVWLHVPSAHFVATSGADKNVARDSGHAKALVKSPWYRETFGITWQVGVTAGGDRIDGMERWVNSAGGERMSQPWLAQWTGQRGDFLLGDDPDDAFKVVGTAAREETRGKYDLAIGSRIKLGGVQMMLQQHVHAEDMTTILKLRGVDERDRDAVHRAKFHGGWSIDNRKLWAAFVLPVEFRPKNRCTTPWGFGDPRTELGEVLFPFQWTPEVIAAEKLRLSLYPCGWDGQGNQDPGQSAGGEVKREWWRFCALDGDPPPIRPRPVGCVPRSGDGEQPAVVIKRRKDGKLDLDWLDITVDPKNGSKSKRSSNVGLVVMGGKGNQRFILDDRTARLGFLATVDVLKQMIIDWSPLGLTSVLIEQKAQGTAATESLEREIAAAQLKDAQGRPIVVKIELVEGGSTSFEDRFNAALPSFRAGMVHILDGAGFTETHIDEVCSVPNGAMDDRADADAQCINHHATGQSAAQQSAAYRNMGAALSGMRL